MQTLLLERRFGRCSCFSSGFWITSSRRLCNSSAVLGLRIVVKGR